MLVPAAAPSRRGPGLSAFLGITKMALSLKPAGGQGNKTKETRNINGLLLLVTNIPAGCFAAFNQDRRPVFVLTNEAYRAGEGT